MDNDPHGIAINLKIIMNKEVTHIRNGTPFYFRMSLLKRNNCQ